MRKVFILLLFTVNLTAYSSKYYIDPSGRDSGTRKGSKSTPWKTLAYACSRVRTPGDIIHVNTGSFYETVQSNLAAGVSIEGEGTSSNIISDISKPDTFTILLSSSREATDGKQHISNIRMDGNSMAAYGAIRVAYRKNVDINNCTFVNFNYYGVSFINGEPPEIYATGNKFHNNIVTNCSGYYNGNRGCLEIQGQDGMLIYGNTMSSDREGGNSGDVIYGVEGFIKNVKIFNNTLSKTYIAGKSSWDFAIEIWNWYEGNEIYNNIITGSIDICNVHGKGLADYSVWVHDNKIGQNSLVSSESTRGIALERNAMDIIIERNYIKNVASGIMVNTQYPDVTAKNIRVSYNIFYNIGVSDSYSDSKGWGILWGAGDGDHVLTTMISNIEIYNNIFWGSMGTRTSMWGIEIPDSGQATRIFIGNNIIYNFDYSAIYARQGDLGGVIIDDLVIENNIFYKNGYRNVPRFNGIKPTHSTIRNNIIKDPMFVSLSDLHLKPGSPAIGKGLKIKVLKVDFNGKPIKDPPNIGVFE